MAKVCMQQKRINSKQVKLLFCSAMHFDSIVLHSHTHTLYDFSTFHNSRRLAALVFLGCVVGPIQDFNRSSDTESEWSFVLVFNIYFVFHCLCAVRKWLGNATSTNVFTNKSKQMASIWRQVQGLWPLYCAEKCPKNKTESKCFNDVTILGTYIQLGGTNQSWCTRSRETNGKASSRSSFENRTFYG